MTSAVAVGADPGRSTGLALVSVRTGAAPTLMEVWQVHGAVDLVWWRRARAACASAADLIAQRAPGHPPTAFIEEIPATLRRNSIAGVTAGHRAWAGLGEVRGMLQACLFEAGFVVVDFPQKSWTTLLGVAPKKDPADPELRLREARMRVAQAGALLNVLPQDSQAANERRVDAAESVLIAAAGAMSLLTQTQQRRWQTATKEAACSK